MNAPFYLLPVILTAGLAAAENLRVGETPPAPAAKAQTQNNPADALQYTDAEKCHVRIAGKTGTFAVIPMLVAAHSFPENNQTEIIVALDTALRGGCDINEPDPAGLQPLNAAILFRDTAMVRHLPEKGADPYQPIHKPGSPIEGLNSFDFLQFIKKNQRKAPASLQDLAPIADVLNHYR